MGNAETSTSREEAYSIKLTNENKLGEGSYATVYKIMSKEDQKARAAKIFKVPFDSMIQLDKMGY